MCANKIVPCPLSDCGKGQLIRVLICQAAKRLEEILLCKAKISENVWSEKCWQSRARDWPIWTVDLVK